MHFELLQMVSANGNIRKANDDRCGAVAKRAWVVDGATDMGPPGLLGQQGGASWLASTASDAFTMVQAQDIETTCNKAFQQIEEQFQRQKTREVSAAWETPKAAFGVAQLTDDGLSVAWAADSPILRIAGGEVSWCTGEPDTSAEAADALALGEGVGAAQSLTGHVLEDRRAHRAREEHFALSPDAKHAVSVTRFAHHPVRPGDELLLMSDGFSSLVTDYQEYTASELAEAVHSKGLAALVHEIREIEQADAKCLRYPRFKISDDATALWVRVV